MVNWRNLQRKLLRDKLFGNKRESCHSPDGVTCARSHKSYSSQKILKKWSYYETSKPLQSSVIEGKLISLAKAKYLCFYLSKDKNDYFCWLQTYFVYVHRVNLKWVPLYRVYLTGNILTFTYSVFYFTKVFLVLGLNNKYIWLCCQLSVPFPCTNLSLAKKL
jgi:hypothetical protein